MRSDHLQYEQTRRTALPLTPLLYITLIYKDAGDDTICVPKRAQPCARDLDSHTL